MTQEITHEQLMDVAEQVCNDQEQSEVSVLLDEKRSTEAQVLLLRKIDALKTTITVGRKELDAIVLQLGLTDREVAQLREDPQLVSI